MSKPQPLPVEHATYPWLIASALVTTLPHVEHQPLWLSLCTGILLSCAGWLWFKKSERINRWVLAVIVVAASAGVFLEFRTLFGRDAGVSLLVIFMSMKLLEIKTRRDGLVLITLGYFLLLTHYLYSQSIPTGLWLLFALWIVTTSLIRLYGDSASSAKSTLRHAGILTTQSIPFMLVLFVLFPRVSGPLWGLPQDAHAGRTGLSESMSPGSISSLVQNGEIAFRARFAGEIPVKQLLYWRGPVLEQFDGSQWQPDKRKYPKENIDALSPSVEYELTLEPHNQRWLLALDAPVNLAPEFALNGRLTTTSRNPLTERVRHTLQASLNFRFNAEENPTVLQRNLLLPENFNPKTRALAEQWKSETLQAGELVNKALKMFATQAFFYTLSPPLLGQHSVDDFLFQTQRGFCEHYAAAFVTLMRAAGVPARVVTGYQGGERNPLDGYLVVRQSDAHAWAEVWLAGQGWVRQDPTAMVSPSRIESGIASALPQGEALPAFMTVRSDWIRSLRFRWEAINNAWNQHILGYDPKLQRELLSHLGWPEVNWQTLATALGIVSSILLGLNTIWTLYQRPAIDPAKALWEKALDRLRRRKVNCAPWETPSALIERLRVEQPDIVEAFSAVAQAYLNTRYGQRPEDLKNLRRAVAQLP